MKPANRNLFRITRFILLKIPFVFGLIARFRKTEQRLLIIKTDAIGDYILFRNFLEETRQSDEFAGYRITLLGNQLWKQLAVAYDSAFVDDFIFIAPEHLYQTPLKTLRLGWRLFKNNYRVVLQPSYTRLLITDGLAGLTAARQAIGFAGDNEGILPRYKAKTDQFYIELLSLPENAGFEFYRSKFFFESVLKRKLSIKSPSIATGNIAKKGVVIFVGAGVSKRAWEKEKFLQLIKLIINHDSTTDIYLAGGPEELPTSEYLMNNLTGQNINNIIGKTSLPQLVQLICGAALVIGNETSAIHIAAATQTKSVCILGGGHFNRFAPYPADMRNSPLCLYEKMECYNCNWLCRFETLVAEPFPCISSVSLESVWGATLGVLSTL